MLQPVRAVVARGFRHRPAVAVLELGQQPVHHVLAGQSGLPPGEARCDLCHQVVEQARVRVMVYAGSSGCRVSLFHKLASSRQSRLTSRRSGIRHQRVRAFGRRETIRLTATATCEYAAKITIYNCRISLS
ncbi:MAG TPA: hypothetical protein VN714_22005 [Trebonia sp.]|nr:hypothetical protein [Trebonia sp.]